MSHSPAEAAAIEPEATAVPSISLSAILPWLIFAALLMLGALYFISTEQGATSLFAGRAVHEWLHDGRHLLGFPCH